VILINYETLILKSSNLLQILIKLKLNLIIPPLNALNNLLHLIRPLFSLPAFLFPNLHAIINPLLLPIELEPLEDRDSATELIVQRGNEEAEVGQAGKEGVRGRFLKAGLFGEQLRQ
jgi:hypothetical protein